MAHTFTNLLTHVVFSTKERVPCIDDEIKAELHAYLGGLVKELKVKALAIGGVRDHVHLLIVLPPTVAMAEVMRFVKANSSKWVTEKFRARNDFAWQRGYAAFSVSRSNVPDVAQYIKTQEAHHAKFDFKAELIALLRKHDVEFDEKYLWK